MQREILEILRQEQGKVLYKIDGEEITYEEVYKRVIEVAANLEKQGDMPVIVYGDKSVDQFVAILACLVAKRCYIPIDTKMPISRIEEIIRKTKASLVLKNEDIVVNDVEVLTLLDLVNKYKDVKNKVKQENDIAYIIFTSGSTGNSKGVPISYSNLEHFVEWITKHKYYQKIKGQKILSQASFSFDLSLMDIYFSIYTRSTIIAISPEQKLDLNYLLEIMRDEEINFLVLTPTFVKLLLLAKEWNAENYGALKEIFFCGEVLETNTCKKIKQRFPRVRVINAYGPTEATCCVSLVEVTDNMLESAYLPVGEISDSAVKIEIKDKEIVLKGASVFAGYLDFSADNCYREEGENCYKTGDRGEIRNNYLFCYGRLDNQVKYHGYRIELGDIENNLLKVKGVKEAVVVAKKADSFSWVKLIKAYVVLDEEVAVEKIKDELRKYIPIYMVPKIIKVLPAIPINNNGKYDRKRLSEE